MAVPVGGDAGAPPVRSTVPQRIDRLPWSGFHRKVVIALGITWVLDGIEITVAGSIADRIRDEQALGFSASQGGLTASIHLPGEVVGALVVGGWPTGWAAGSCPSSPWASACSATP